MKAGNYLPILIILLFPLFCTYSQNIPQNQELIYSTSFETDADTIGWVGINEYRNDIPPGGGTRCAFITGGCQWPHAWFNLPPTEGEGFYRITFWGKLWKNFGNVAFRVLGEPLPDDGIYVKDTTWKFYQSVKPYYCDKNKIIEIVMRSGNYLGGGMFIDNVELIKVNPSPGWIIRETGTDEHLNDVSMINPDIAIVVGHNKTILKTTNAGLTWRNTAPDCLPNVDCSFNLNSVRFFDETHGIAAGGAKLLYTSDGGEQWNFLNAPGAKNFLCIGESPLNNIYVGDDSGYVYNSLDTGKTWTAVRISQKPVKKICLMNENAQPQQLCALTSDAQFVKAINSAGAWSNSGVINYFNTAGSEAFAECFSPGGIGFISGISANLNGQAIITKSTPPDARWYLSNLSEYKCYDIEIPEERLIYSCGTHGQIIKTTDNGDTWFSLLTGTSNTLRAIYLYDSNIGMAVGEDGTILYTSTGGMIRENHPPDSFSLIGPANNESLPVEGSISFSWNKAVDQDADDVKYMLHIGSNPGNFTNSYGPFTDTSYTLQNNWMTPGSYQWMVIATDGELNTISTESFLLNLNAVLDVPGQEQIPYAFALEQNFPNPFNPSTNFGFQIADFGLVTLKVYDLLGNEISTLINEQKAPGKYNVEFNASGLSSGVYYARLESGGKQTIRKIVLMK